MNDLMQGSRSRLHSIQATISVCEAHVATPNKKAQLSVYLDPHVMQALSAYAARREQSMSLIAEATIASFLSPDADERREAAIAKRLDQ